MGACLPQTGEICKPGCHEVFLGTKTSCPADEAADRQYGLGWVTNVINGGLECGGVGDGKGDYRVHSRVRFYKHFCSIWVLTHWRRVGQRMIIFSALISRTMLLHRLL